MWTFDDSRAVGTPHLPSAAMRKYYDWRRLIRDSNIAPKPAAEQVGDLNYKSLVGAPNQFEIRLNQHHRATFSVDGSTETVTVYQIGGHT